MSEVDPNYADFVPRKFEGSAVRGTCAVEGAAMRSGKPRRLLLNMIDSVLILAWDFRSEQRSFRVL